ncbi:MULTISPECIES: bacteriocin immunity protein [Lactobacillus]|uniref:Bacteriocin immunity protein n=1 Tax=Lactobacillus xujianguonis TaxID=2495899 RepID=A0A437SWY4_9LACO|nr:MULTISPECIES: bacteriocin immunity protein [Lactobacillus]RVU71337.1 bacteriocin immunity protein [Lactobacillus xujianguonis]RVU74040.1 bacteriocin immunity protein [Lactobacillus xujianguonis]
MLKLFTHKTAKTQLTGQAYQILDQFYRSFSSNMYNELNIHRYKQIRDAVGLVMRKFDSHDHPLAYTSKLVMYIQARVCLNHLPLTKEQQSWMKKLTDITKHINLNYVYLSPLDSENQFI